MEKAICMNSQMLYIYLSKICMLACFTVADNEENFMQHQLKYRNKTTGLIKFCILAKTKL